MSHPGKKKHDIITRSFTWDIWITLLKENCIMNIMHFFQYKMLTLRHSNKDLSGASSVMSMMVSESSTTPYRRTMLLWSMLCIISYSFINSTVLFCIRFLLKLWQNGKVNSIFIDKLLIIYFIDYNPIGNIKWRQ